MSTKGASFRKDVQGLRAVAVLFVLVFHAGLPLPGGFTGVDMFLVVSGYVICRSLLRESVRTGAISVLGFFARRVRRLLPALALVFVVVGFLTPFLAPALARGFSLRTAVAGYLLNANHYLLLQSAAGGYFAPVSENNVFLHLWSLSVEEQFYLAFPFLALVLATRGRPVYRFGLLIGVLSVVSFVASAVLVHTGSVAGFPGQIVAFYSMPTRVWEFGIGILLALSHRAECGVFRRRFGFHASWAGVMLLVVSGWLLSAESVFPGPLAVLPCAATGLLIEAGWSNPRNPVSQALSMPLPVWIGDISYGLYLWHWPLIIFANATLPPSLPTKVLACLLAFVPAYLSYRWVEKRVFEKAVATWPLAARAAVLGVVGAVGLVAGLYIARVEVRGTAFHLDYTEGCDSKDLERDRPAKVCRFNADAENGRILLVGDSHAGHWTEAVLGAARSEGYEVVVHTVSGCPLSNVEHRWEANMAQRNDCPRLVDNVLQVVEKEKPDIVLVSSAFPAYVSHGQGEFRSKNGPWSSDEGSRAVALAQGFEDTLETLRTYSDRVVVIAPTPVFPGWSPGHRSAAAGYLGSAGPSATVGREEALAYVRKAQFVIDVAISVDVDVLDVFDEICPGDPCAPVLDGVWQYRDDDHLSVKRSEQLSGVFKYEVLSASGGD